MSSDYEFWFRQGNNFFLLPMNPEKISINNKSANKTVEVDGLGEVTIIQSPNLLEFSFDFELPADYYYGCQYYNVPDPKTAFKLLQNMQRTGQLQFIVTNTIINHCVTIEDLSPEEEGGDVGTLKVKISLKEYKEPKARQVQVSFKKVTYQVLQSRPPALAPAPQATNDKPVQRTHTVGPGDCLWSLAKKYYGDGSKWPVIHEANKNKIKNPNLIIDGWVLVIP